MYQIVHIYLAALFNNFWWFISNLYGLLSLSSRYAHWTVSNFVGIFTTINADGVADFHLVSNYFTA